MGVLREYHAATGALILEYEGTLERFTGDGMMIFFNDPVPVPDARRARRADGARHARSRRPTGPRLGGARLRPEPRHRHRPGLRDARRDRLRGALGLRRDRHRDQPRRAALRRGGGDQILVSQRVAGSVAEAVELDEMRLLNLRGFHRPVTTCAVRRLAAAGS